MGASLCNNDSGQRPLFEQLLSKTHEPQFSSRRTVAGGSILFWYLYAVCVRERGTQQRTPLLPPPSTSQPLFLSPLLYSPALHSTSRSLVATFKREYFPPEPKYNLHPQSCDSDGALCVSNKRRGINNRIQILYK